MPLQATSGAASYDAFGGGVAVVPNYIEDVFSTWLFTANGATNLITNNIDLSTKGGLVVLKGRNGTQGSFGWGWFDTARGINKSIASNDAASQVTSTNALTAFRTTGFTLGADDNAVAANTFSGSQSASWTLRKQPKFFDVVTWTGNGANRTIAHNLGSVPGCIMVKRTDATADWQVYHRSNANTEYMVLNSSAAKATGATRWNSTTPTSTVFSLGTDATVNASGGTYVAYVYAHDAGGFGLTGTDNVISCGSFNPTSNGSVDLGYEPQWIIAKKATGTGGAWFMWDSMRGWPAGRTVSGQVLRANEAIAEAATSGIAPTATGFDYAALGDTWIYIAIRRGPMKVPTTGTSVFAPVARAGTNSVANVTSGFPTDLFINLNRNHLYFANNPFFDRLRGLVYSNSESTAAETDGSPFLSAYGNTGVTLTNSGLNNSATTYITYSMGRAPGFFDVVCYTGNGVTRDINHNLGVTPEFYIVKQRSGGTSNSGWATGGTVYPNSTDYYTPLLNSNQASIQVANAWRAPTSTTFGIGTAYPADNTWNYSGALYVAYLFASAPGVSKVGSYTGNGTTQAIACGFTGGARFVLIKRTDSTGDWYVYDTARGMTVLTDPFLLLNSIAAETATLGSVITSTGGFTVNAAILAAINTNAATYIFLAIA